MSAHMNCGLADDWWLMESIPWHQGHVSAPAEASEKDASSAERDEPVLADVEIQFRACSARATLRIRNVPAHISQPTNTGSTNTLVWGKRYPPPFNIKNSLSTWPESGKLRRVQPLNGFETHKRDEQEEEGAGWEDDLEELTGFLGWHFEHPAAASK